MLTLVYDTETTGMVDFKAPPDAPHQPGLVQLGAIFYDERRVVGELNVVVRPVDIDDKPIPIGPEAMAKHGISEGDVKRFGVPQFMAVGMLGEMGLKADRVVVFNVEFDHLVIRAAQHREGGRFRPCGSLLARPAVCAMLSAKPVCKLPGRYADYKWPSLAEAYRMLVDPQGFEGAHDAMADVRAAAAVLWALEDGGHPLVTIKSCEG